MKKLPIVQEVPVHTIYEKSYACVKVGDGIWEKTPIYFMQKPWAFFHYEKETPEQNFNQFLGTHEKNT